MKMLLKIIFAFLILAVSSAKLFAGDEAELTFIGFSKDGKYLAYEESEYSGEGTEYKKVATYIVDTVKNSFATAPVVYELESEDDRPSKLKAVLHSRYKRNVAVKLKRFAIVRGNLGQLVVSHLIYDWSYVKPVERMKSFYQSDGTEIKKMVTDYEGGYVPKEGPVNEKIIFNPYLSDFVPDTSAFYELSLKMIENEQGPNKMELTLKDNTEQEDKPVQILQKDGDNIPESRRNPSAYKIERVYLYSGKIAVFLNVFSWGFESTHVGYMVVTGEIK